MATFAAVKSSLNHIKAVLFDLDGVVVLTESQYDEFWGGEIARYYPDRPEINQAIKGQTLVHIYEKWFSGPLEKEQPGITARLNDFEANMRFDYTPGLIGFIADLRSHGIKTALVTSSNHPKMESVYRARPEFKSLFDRILTSEDFSHSKPHPECYLMAADGFGLNPADCVVCEDSYNGLRSGRAAGALVLGLTTSHSAAELAPYSDMQIPDFKDFTYEKLCRGLC